MGTEFEFIFIKRGTLGLNLSPDKLAVTGLKVGGCIELRNRELSHDKGVKLLDRIVKVNGEECRNLGVLASGIFSSPDGDSVKLTVRRPFDHIASVDSGQLTP